MRLVEPVQAKVIRPALQQRRRETRAEHAAHLRQVAMKELVLQRLRARRYDHALAGHQRGHKIREGLAGAGAGFGDQHLALGDRFLDRCGHRLLRRTWRITGYLARERTIGTEQISSGGHRFAPSP
jgi:hypothetical protein